MGIASNESFSGWTKTFTDPRLCAAIVALLEPPTTPQVRAALYQVLATLPGVTSLATAQRLRRSDPQPLRDRDDRRPV